MTDEQLRAELQAQLDQESRPGYRMKIEWQLNIVSARIITEVIRVRFKEAT
jgi:hypothetical protein